MARASVGVSTCSPASIAASTSSPPYPPSKDFSKLDSTSSGKTSPFVAWRTEDGVSAEAVATAPRPRRCVKFVTPVKRLGVDTSAMTAASSAVPSDGGCDSVPPSSSPSKNVRRRGVSSIAPGASSPRVPFVDRTFITSRSVGLCTRGVGSLSDDAALPGIHGDILYTSRDSHSSSTSPSSSRDGSAVLAATDADDIVVAPTGDPNEPIAPVATANDIVTASSSALSSSSSSSAR
mmetsp:Transcript_220/g.838  ORF Transcript_220/g.838 Transcript_220/m.838 type:complete len:235 (+) Transcript_220:2926-3630(+)